MRGRSAASTRRSFLQNGLFALLAGGAALQQEDRYRVVPKPADQHRHQTNGGADNDQLKQALNQKVKTLQGFDPMRYLTAFDYGVERKLANGRTLREFEIIAKDVNLEVAPGIFFPAWTFNGSVPGPTLRCKEGDVIRVHFHNRSVSEHTIHFHGIHPANMDGATEIVNPNSSFIYEFTAEPFGLQFYHCHTPPVSLHMNRGLFGAFIIDPNDARPRAREMVMITHGWDINFDGQNEIYAVNGPANYYRDYPIELRVGEHVRIYLLNALEFDLVNSFHLHANFFKVYRTGSQLVPDAYTDIVTLSQAERCVIEFVYSLAGSYMFHAHQNTFAELGWMGHFNVVT